MAQFLAEQLERVIASLGGGAFPGAGPPGLSARRCLHVKQLQWRTGKKLAHARSVHTDAQRALSGFFHELEHVHSVAPRAASSRSRAKAGTQAVSLDHDRDLKILVDTCASERSYVV